MLVKISSFTIFVTVSDCSIFLITKCFCKIRENWWKFAVSQYLLALNDCSFFRQALCDCWLVICTVIMYIAWLYSYNKVSPKTDQIYTCFLFYSEHFPRIYHHIIHKYCGCISILHDNKPKILVLAYIGFTSTYWTEELNKI